MQYELRPLPPHLENGHVCSHWHWLAWVVGFLLLLAVRTRQRAIDGELRNKAARWAVSLFVMWLGAGILARMDPRSKDLFVLVSLLVIAGMLIDVCVSFAGGAWLARYVLLNVAASAVALITFVREWPEQTGVFFSCFGMHDDIWFLLAGMRTSDHLPWCSRSHFGLAHAAMAVSSSASLALAAVACTPRPQGGLPRSLRIQGIAASLGALTLLGLWLFAELGRGVSWACR